MAAVSLPLVGGKEYVMHHLGNALADLGHYVAVVAKRVSWEQPKNKRAYDLYRYGVPVRGSGRTGLDFSSAILITSILHLKKKFDVLNCHSVDYSGTIARYLKSLHGLPLVMTPHGMDVQKTPDIGYGFRLDPAWDRRISKNLKAADYVTAISRSVHGVLDMIPEERIVDIPNGIHVERFTGPSSRYLYEYLGIPGTKRIILSVGRNHIVKGYDYGIRAVSKLVKDMGVADVHYVIVGRGVTDHKNMVAKCQAQSFISLLDELPPEKITQCYKSAAIFFSPSILEGMSLVSIEAMAAGLPLVVTDVPGNEDVVKENGCGVIVKSKDEDDMAMGLDRLLGNDAYREKLAEMSEQCAGKYDWSQIARQYENVYQRAIQVRRSR